MRRYWLPPESIQGELVDIVDDPFHHIFDVCRQEIGSRFEVLGAGDRALLVEVIAIGKKKATAKVVSTRQIPPLPRPRLVLALSIPRYHVMDSIVERAVEMGVAEIRPFFSDFSFIRKSAALSESKIERWKKIVISATQQCGRHDLMPVHEAIDFDDLLKRFNQNTSAAGLFAYEGASPLAIKDFARELSGQHQEIWIFVGSEGGFSPAEIQKIQDLGLAPVTLGDQVLRVETACIALVSVLKYELGLMASQTGGA